MVDNWDNWDNWDRTGQKQTEPDRNGQKFTVLPSQSCTGKVNIFSVKQKLVSVKQI